MNKYQAQNYPEDIRSNNKKDLAYEIKVAFILLQRVKVEYSTYIELLETPQPKNERKNLLIYLQIACIHVTKELNYVRFLNSVVDGVSCGYDLVRGRPRKYIKGTTYYIGVTDTNHNSNNILYQIIGGSCSAVMVGYLFDPGLLYMTGVSE